MLDFVTARARIIERVRALSGSALVERVPLSLALGRVLAEDAIARAPLPAHDYSAMDGYAVCRSDLKGDAPYSLSVVGESRTGSPLLALEEGKAARIFTGAHIPGGADAVIMQENVERLGDLIRFSGLPRAGENIRIEGEDLAAGAVALRAGTRLTPFHLGLLAMLEKVEVVVARRPRVHILCTGDELRPPGDLGSPNSLADSNSVVLRALVSAAGGEPLVLPIGKDDLEGLTAALREGIRGADLVLTVGGVSVGDHDVVKPALAALGAETEFWKVAMKPGKPLLFATLNETSILGLPGNPASAQVTFLLFGLPILRAMSGEVELWPKTRTARITAEFRQKPGRRSFLRARLEGDEVTPLLNQASGAGTAMAWANALLVVPEETELLTAGSLVEVVAYSEL